MALLYQAGRVSLHRNAVLEEALRPAVFISHCWREHFKSFVKTLKKVLDLDTQMWVCSFAIWQHGDISEQLTDLQSCPFAVALRSSARVLVVTDQSIEVFTRCWCVLEATFAMKWGKPYEVCIEENMNMNLWSQTLTIVANLKLEDCLATYREDKDAIIAYAQSCDGGIDILNEKVREVFRKSAQRARLSNAASRGDLSILENAHEDDLRELEDVRGRGLLHVTAVRGQISSMMQIAQRVGKNEVDRIDDKGMSPMCVAAQEGAVAGVQGLLTLQADLEGASSNEGLTPLHYASLGGSAKIVLMLLNCRANVEAAGRYRDNEGRRPLHLAAKSGHVEVTRLLIQRRADCNAQITNGSTVLWHAVHAGHTAVVATLLSSKVDANLQNDDRFKRSPLMAAVKNDSAALVSILLGAQANVHLRDADHYTCLDYATNSQSAEAELIVSLICKARELQKRSRRTCIQS